MTVETQAPGMGGTNPRIVDCSKQPATSDKKFSSDPCEMEEICAKAKAQNASNGGKPQRVDTSSAEYIENRTKIGPAAQTAFRVDNAGVPPEAMQDKFLANCRYDEWKNNKPAPDPGFREPTMLEADHVVELQMGGAPGAENLKWCSERVNGFFGPKMQHFKPSHTGVRAVNCGCT